MTHIHLRITSSQGHDLSCAEHLVVVSRFLDLLHLGTTTLEQQRHIWGLHKSLNLLQPTSTQCPSLWKDSELNMLTSCDPDLMLSWKCKRSFCTNDHEQRSHENNPNKNMQMDLNSLLTTRVLQSVWHAGFSETISLNPRISCL